MRTLMLIAVLAGGCNVTGLGVDCLTPEECAGEDCLTPEECAGEECTVGPDAMRFEHDLLDVVMKHYALCNDLTKCTGEDHITECEADLADLLKAWCTIYPAGQVCQPQGE